MLWKSSDEKELRHVFELSEYTTNVEDAITKVEALMNSGTGVDLN